MPFLIFFTLIQCENDIEKIKSFSNESVIPIVSGKNFEIYKSDSAKIQVRILAPEIYHFADVEEPYIEFPKGIEVFFFDSLQQVESMIKAQYAIYYELQKLWNAKNDVRAYNLTEGEELYTEELYWDEGKSQIYSDKFTKIITPDGTFFGNEGFESNQSFSKWKLFEASKSKFKIKDEKKDTIPS